MWRGIALLLLLAAAAHTSPSNEHVPPLPLSISKNTTITNETIPSNNYKVPTSNAASAAIGYMPLQQTSASVFFVNYNQQNVVQLRHNVENKLHSIRNVEMLVTKIQVSAMICIKCAIIHIDFFQEIFDSIHFASSVTTRLSSGNDNETVQQDLQAFSQRLGRKLQRATHVVLELRDLLRFNLSKVLLQQHSYDDDGEDEQQSEFDFEVEEEESRNPAANNENMHLYLNTQIEKCQPYYETNVDAVSLASAHYNKQQIQILNYLKSDEVTRGTFLNENNGRSLAANSYIADQLAILRQLLSNNPSDNEANSSSKNKHSKNKPSSNSNSASHFKHIYFLSSSDGALGTAHFRRLYVSAIKRKFVMLLIDVGSALNAELFEITKSFGRCLMEESN